MMDLLERYLAEVRRNLPARQADDIVAELRDLLLARAEEQEETTGNVDWEALLRDFGHPLVIAARYRSHQWLIGPELYPFYLHFLKVVVAIVVAVSAGLAIIKGVLWAADPGPCDHWLPRQPLVGRRLSDRLGHDRLRADRALRRRFGEAAPQVEADGTSGDQCLTAERL